MNLFLILYIALFAVPLLSAYHPAIMWYRNFRAVSLAILVSGGFFLVLDSIFVHASVKGTADVYLSGISIFSLPIETILFYICVPFANLFVYEIVRMHVFHRKWCFACDEVIVGAAVVASIVLASFTDRVYTVSIASIAIVLSIGHVYKIKKNYQFVYLATCIPLLFFYILLSRYLSGGSAYAESLPIVWYADRAISNIQILSVSIEELLHFYVIQLLAVTVYEHFRK
jgi:lycopene cyclase domain-containing protein